MDRIETEEFSVVKGNVFEAVVAAAGSVAFKRQPETMFAAQMSVWTTDPDDGISPADRLTEMLSDAPLIAERRAVVFAGMSGEAVHVVDRLKDYETDESRPWHRLRIFLVAPDGSAWYHATAISDAEDLPAVEAELAQVLSSITVKATGEQGREARARAAGEVDTLFGRMVEENQLAAEQVEARRESAIASRTLPPVKDVETCFDAAIAAVGLIRQREALRSIALPTLLLTEAGESDVDQLGLSRVGGGPDLAEATAWPRDRSGFHLNFLAQIDLADLSKRYEAIPADGLLSFFSGTDYSDGTVLYAPSGSVLVAHDLLTDAEETAIQGMALVQWDSTAKRFVADATTSNGLSVETDTTGRMRFLRDGEPVVVLASEYEISRSRQTLRFDRSLTVPFGIPDTVPQAYLDAGLEDPSDFCLAVGKAFKIGDGPQHQMFGVTGIRDLLQMQNAAVEHARASGWHDICEPGDWFILLKLASGGEVDFSFSDYGDFIFMANRRDTRKGDFSRICAFVESG